MKVFEDSIKWSRSNFNDLPWRLNRTPYSTLVSEIMLQQTTVSTVLKHYSRFLERFPTIDDLAQTSEEEVVKQWEGLGYYRRARNLHRAAKEISLKYPHSFPNTYDELTSIKGIGDYTASAILSLCFKQKFLAFDANIERVLSRFYRSKELKGKKNIQLLRKLFPEEIEVNWGFLNEAFMDIGRNYCKAKSMACITCPLREKCKSAFSESAVNLPLVKEKNQPKKINLKILRVIKRKEDTILFFKRPKGKWLEGQLELPSYILESEEKSFKQYPKSGKIEYGSLRKIKSAITKYKITNYIFDDEKDSFGFQNNKGIWIKKSDLSNYHITTTSLKILR